MRAPIYGSSSDPAPQYLPASDPVLSGYSDSSDVFGGTTGPNSTTLISSALDLAFVGSAPAPVSTPSSQPAPVQSAPTSSPASSAVGSPVSAPAPSPVSAPAPMQPQITRTTNKTQSKGKIMAGQVNGTVTAASPLRVVVDGATVDSLAASLDGATYLLDDRVLVQLRNPQIPVILGVVT
ncbi:MAG: hypothetical protein WA090_09395 [Candidatus Nanopelagicaceae bacterium]